MKTMVGPREAATRDLIAASAAAVERWLEAEEIEDLDAEMGELELRLLRAGKAYERPT